MKKGFLLLCCLLLMSGCTQRVTPAKSPQDESAPASVDTVRAVWLPYYDLQKLIQGKDERQFVKTADEVCRNLKDIGFNTLTVQVRPCADAFYPSSLFPSSRYCFGTQGAPMPYDPFKIMCSAAEKHHLHIEAWVNPYRVSQDNRIDELCDGHIAKQWYRNKKTASRVYIGKKKIFFNPASEEVVKLIVKGVVEIVQNYPVSAVHFDDYFYPVQSEDIDKKEYRKYRKNGGEKPLAVYRRERVSHLLQSVYSEIKRINPSVRFGVSPAANIKTDTEQLYADVTRWVSEEGYLDYVCPQVYFGFRNVHQPFMFTVKKWMYITECDLYIGLPLYKAGKTDRYAAEEDGEARSEFVSHDDIIARQIIYLSKLPQIKGFYVFCYGNLQDMVCQKEVKNMIAAMQSSNQ